VPIETSNTIPYHRIEKAGTDLQYPGLLISHTPQLLISEIVLMDMKESKIFFLFLVSQHFFDKSCRYSNSVDRFFNVAEIINPLFSNDAAAEK